MRYANTKDFLKGSGLDNQTQLLDQFTMSSIKLIKINSDKMPYICRLFLKGLTKMGIRPNYVQLPVFYDSIGAYVLPYSRSPLMMSQPLPHQVAIPNILREYLELKINEKLS